MWFICEEVTLGIMICCTQVSLLHQLHVPTGLITSLGHLTSPVMYPVISQLKNTHFILSFHLCQFLSIKWSQSAILFMLEYSCNLPSPTFSSCTPWNLVCLVRFWLFQLDSSLSSLSDQTLVIPVGLQVSQGVNL